MKVYITYDRYEHNEWFSVYEITNDINELKKNYKEHLIDFISYGPDDCHQYQIQEVDMTEEEYEFVKGLVDQNEDPESNKTEEDALLDEIMEGIYNECNRSNCLLSTDGCSDNVDVVHFYLQFELGLDQDETDPEEYEEKFDEINELFNEDSNLYQKTLKEYIDVTYDIF